MLKEKRSVLLNTIFFSVYAVSLFGSNRLPDGLFILKELYYGFVVVLLVLFLFFVARNQNNAISIRVSLIDLLIFTLFVLIPSVQFLFFDINSFDALYNQSTFAFFFFIVSTLIRSFKPKQLCETYLNSSFIYFFILTILAIIQYLGFYSSNHYLSKITGSFFNPGPFAIYYVFFSISNMIKLNVSIRERSTKWTIIYGGLALTSCLILSELDSRTAWIVFVMSVICITYHQFELGKIFKNKIWRSFLLVTFIILISVIFAFKFYYHKSDSADGRILIWKVALKMIYDAPIQGHGFRSFAENYQIYQSTTLSSDLSLRKRFGNLAGETIYAFNDVMQTCAEVGVIGGLILISLFTLPIYKIKYSINRSNLRRLDFREDALLLSLCIILSFFISGLTSYTLQMLPSMVLFLFSLSITSVILPFPTFKVHSCKLGTLLKLLIVTISLFHLFHVTSNIHYYVRWCSVGTTFYNQQQFQNIHIQENAEFYLQAAEFYHRNGEYKNALVFYEKTLQYSFQSEVYYAIGNCYEKLGNVDKAIECYKVVSNAIPSLIRPKYLLTTLYLKQNKTAEAKQICEVGLKMLPKVENVDFIRMQKELKFIYSSIKD